MFLEFPPNFIWGTSTAAAQIETPFEHEWKGITSKDGYIFNRTSDHELRRDEDLEYITKLGNSYRMGLDWSRLQRKPMGEFDPAVVNEYQNFIAKLRARGITIMLVLHHFTNPNWFVEAGSWQNSKTIPMFLDYAQKVVDNFGPMVSLWNTFNEPAVYATNAYFMGHFPPFKKNVFTFWRVVKNMSRAHKLAVMLIKNAYPDAPVGISKNCVIFHPENVLGKIPAMIADKIFMDEIAERFSYGVDFWGMSYYARVPLSPFPITEVDTPGKLDEMKRPHDKMWEYYPQGMKESIKRYWEKYKLPIIITESGICTDDSNVRIQSIRDYLTLIYQCMQEGVDVKGYYHWTTMDNFEWSLGPTYRFGLVHVDFNTGDRTMKKCGEFYSGVVQKNGIEI